MKCRVDGRHFSRREQVQVESFAELVKLLPEGRIPGFGERLARLVANAKALLESRGLPSSYLVKETTFKPDPDGHLMELCSGRTLDREIAGRGFKRDSQEDFAARIIVAAGRLGGSSGEDRDAQAFELGRLYAMVRVYGVESADGRVGGGQIADQERNQRIIRRYEELKAEGLTSSRVHRRLAAEELKADGMPMTPDGIKKIIQRAKKAGT